MWPSVQRFARNLVPLLAIGVAVVPASSGPSNPAPSDRSVWEQMREADMRLATAGFRLSVAAAPLCDRLEPGLGIQFHTLAQYGPGHRDTIGRHFGFAGAVAVEGVVPASPADRAGVRPDDTILRVGRVEAPAAIPAEASTAPLIALHAQLAELDPRGAVDVTVIRGGQRLTLRVVAIPACRTRYEMRIASGFEARANGEIVQISSKYFEAVDPELFPAVVAHELAHNILRHRDRLVAQGAEFGLASGFGKNMGLFRQTEIQADILSVHLLNRAGYPPTVATRFWREVGPDLLEGRIRSRSHPALKDRIATLEAEIAKIVAAGPNPPLPEFYVRRGDPLDGNWRSLLVSGGGS